MAYRIGRHTYGVENIRALFWQEGVKLEIGSFCSIANNITIMLGGNHNTEPYTIVGGNPARVIKKRFDDETIDALLRLKWWDLEDAQINEIVPLLCSEDFRKVFDIYEHRM